MKALLVLGFLVAVTVALPMPSELEQRTHSLGEASVQRVHPHRSKRDTTYYRVVYPYRSEKEYRPRERETRIVYPYGNQYPVTYEVRPGSYDTGRPGYRYTYKSPSISVIRDDELPRTVISGERVINGDRVVLGDRVINGERVIETEHIPPRTITRTVQTK